MCNKKKVKLPLNLLIYISGVPGVGKTSIARELMKVSKNFFVVQEYDICRESIRGFLIQNNLSDDFTIINSSTSALSHFEIMEQTRLLSNSIVYISRRLNKKHIPSIIEGASISFRQLLMDKNFLSLFESNPNIFFIYLYLSDEEEHRKRIQKRCVQYNDFNHLNYFNNIRENNRLFHNEIELLKNNGVFCDEKQIPLNIIEIDTKPTFLRSTTSSIRITANKIFNYLIDYYLKLK